MVLDDRENSEMMASFAMNLSSRMFRSMTALVCLVAFSGCDSSDDDEQDSSLSDPQTMVGITENNYEDVLHAAVQATNVTALEQDAERVHSLARELLVGHKSNLLGEQGLSFVSEAPFSDGVNHLYSCDAGGSLELSVYDFSGTTSRWGQSFENCVVGSDLFDGDFTSKSTSFESTITAFNSFSATFADGSAFAIDGDYSSTTARAGIIATQSWEDTDYSQSGISGAVFRQSDLTRHSKVNYTRDLSGDSGYVSLADGTVGLVSPFEDNAGIVAEFDLDTTSEELGQFRVSSNLAFDSDYYDWNSLNPDGRLNFVVPTYPVSDLGSQLALEGLDGAANFLVESLPQIPKGSEQWNSGEMTVTSADGSHVVMRPSADDQAMVEIQVNDTSVFIQQAWSEELQVILPAALAGRR